MCYGLRDKCLYKGIVIIFGVGKLDYRFVIYVIVSWFLEDVVCKDDELFDLRIMILKVFIYVDCLSIFEKKLKNFGKIVMLFLGVGMKI